MLKINSLKDRKLQHLLAIYRYTQIVEDREYDKGQGPKLDGAINDAVKKRT